MAKKVLIVDDLDGTEGAETVRLSFGSNTVELDLAPANTGKLEKMLAPYFEAGRRAKTSVTTKRLKNNPPEVKAHLDAIRHWARANGYSVSDMGRIPQRVEDAFNEAHKPGKVQPEFSSAS